MDKELLKRWLRHYESGKCLFTPDDAATHVFVILRGRVQLHGVKDNSQQLVATLGPGDILGEKILLEDKPYLHNFFAKTSSQCEIIQFDPKDLPHIESIFPDFKMRLLSAVTTRLNKANEFIRILQTSDSAERVARYIKYFMEYNKVVLGPDISFTASEIANETQLPLDEAQNSLRALVESHALSEQEGTFKVIHLDVIEHRLKSAA